MAFPSTDYRFVVFLAYREYAAVYCVGTVLVKLAVKPGSNERGEQFTFLLRHTLRPLSLPSLRALDGGRPLSQLLD